MYNKDILLCPFHTHSPLSNVEPGQFFPAMKNNNVVASNLSFDASNQNILFTADAGKNQLKSISIRCDDIIGCRVVKSSDALRPRACLLISAYHRVREENRVERRVKQIYNVFSQEESEKSRREQLTGWAELIIEKCLVWRSAPNKIFCAKTRLLVFLNPFSGPGKASEIFQKRVAKILSEAGIYFKVITTERANQARDIASSLNIEDWDGVIIVGGDGLVFELLNGLISRPDIESSLSIPIGIIPGGSGNALSTQCCFGSRVSCKFDFTAEAAFIIAKPRFKTAKLIRVQTADTNMISFLGIGWGFLADVDIESEKFRRLLGSNRFTAGSLIRLVNPRDHRGRLYFKLASANAQSASEEEHSQINNDPTHKRIEDYDSIKMPALNEPVPSDWTFIEDNFISVYVMYASHLCSSSPYMPLSQFGDNLMYLTLIRSGGTSRMNMLKFLTGIETGDHLKLPFFEVYPITAIRIERCNDASFLTVDGESIKCQGPVQAVISRLKANVMTADFVDDFVDSARIIEKM